MVDIYKEGILSEINGTIAEGPNDLYTNLPMYIFNRNNVEFINAIQDDIINHLQLYKSSKSDITLLDILSIVTSPNGSITDEKKDFSKESKQFQFYLGPALSGAPFHHHGPAFNMLLHGVKLWTITPPGRDLYSSMHPLEWSIAGGTAGVDFPYNETTSQPHQDSLYDDGPCEIDQRTGDVVFIPRHWSHQVINLAESVGVAIELDKYIH